MRTKPEQLWDNLCDYTANIRESHNVPGVSVGVYYQGKIYSSGFGVNIFRDCITLDDIAR